MSKFSPLYGSFPCHASLTFLPKIWLLINNYLTLFLPRRFLGAKSLVLSSALLETHGYVYSCTNQGNSPEMYMFVLIQRIFFGSFHTYYYKAKLIHGF